MSRGSGEEGTWGLVYPAAIDLLPDRPNIDARLAAFAATARTDEAAAARARQHWLAQAAREDATLAGVLADLAEQGEPVVVRCGDRHHPGRVDVVGADHVVLHDDRGGRALVAYRAISSVSAARSSALARDPAARTVEATADLADTLRVLAEDRAAVLVHAAGADVGGELTAVGHDVVWLADVAVPLASIDWVMVR